MEQLSKKGQLMVRDLEANQRVPYCEGTIVAMEPPRFISEENDRGLRSLAVFRDASGEVKISLWGSEASEVELGDRIAVRNGFVTSHQGDRVLSAGKFGTISILG